MEPHWDFDTIRISTSADLSVRLNCSWQTQSFASFPALVQRKSFIISHADFFAHIP